MGKVYNIYKKRCSSYLDSHKSYIGNTAIDEVISTLLLLDEPLAKIYAMALTIEDYNGEAKYNEYVVGNKSLSLRSYRNKHNNIDELVKLCKEWNNNNPEEKILYGYYPDDDNYCMFFKIYGCKYSVSWHSMTLLEGIPYLKQSCSGQCIKANLFVLKKGILNTFPGLFKEEDINYTKNKTVLSDKEKAAERERKKRERMHRKMLRIIGDDFLKNDNKEKKENVKPINIEIKQKENTIPISHGGSTVKVERTEVVSGMSQTEKFNARFSIVKKKGG